MAFLLERLNLTTKLTLMRKNKSTDLNIMNFKILILATSLLTPHITLAAFPEQEMENMFNAMINTTTPDAYKNAQRGSIAGGQLYVTVPRKNVDIVSMAAPSISIGCGGINLFGGSLSFLSTDEIVETFQAIGSNALFYGVKLAMTNYCATCEQVMTSLEKTAQMFNSMNLDSCQAAQGIVTTIAEQGTDSVGKSKAAAINTFNGYKQDFGDAWKDVGSNNTSPQYELKAKSPAEYKEKITGNYVWRALYKNKNAITNAFGTSEGDIKALETFMTITGTVISNDKNVNDDGSVAPDAKDKEPKLNIFAGNLLSIKNFIDGGEFPIYKCDNNSDKDGCLNPIINNDYKITLPSMKTTINKGLYDLIDSFHNDTPFTENAKKVAAINLAREQICINQLKNLSVAQRGNMAYSRSIADNCSSIMALEAVHGIFNEIMYATEKSTRGLIQEQQKTAILHLDKSRNRFNVEYQQIADKMPNYNMNDDVEYIIRSSMKDK